MPYSAKKIMANFSDPYSMLNPDTNSDSPSAKSNGVRFSSAITVTNQGKRITTPGRINPRRPLCLKKLIRLILPHKIVILSIINASEIS